jgi:hypothetical protein
LCPSGPGVEPAAPPAIIMAASPVELRAGVNLALATLFASREWPGVRLRAQLTYPRGAQGTPPKRLHHRQSRRREARPNLNSRPQQALRRSAEVHTFESGTGPGASLV